MPDDLYPAVGPSPVATVLGALLVVAALAWMGWVWWWTRPERPTALAATPDLAALRHETLARIDELAAEHDAGTIDGRQLLQAVSPLVRRFVFDATGTPAHVESLADVRAAPGRGADGLDVALALMYPEEFAVDSPGAVAAALDHARRVVIATRADGAQP